MPDAHFRVVAPRTALIGHSWMISDRPGSGGTYRVNQRGVPMLDASYSQRPYSYRSGLSAAAPAPQLNPMLGLLASDARHSLASALLATEPRRPAYLEAWAVANFGNELQKPSWGIDDAVPIILGINPFFAPPQIMAKNEFSDLTAGEVMRIRRLVADAQLMGDLRERFRPHEFINWALAQHIPVPESLIKLAASRGRPINGYPNPVEVLQGKYRELVEKAKAELAIRDGKIAELEAEVRERTVEASEFKRERDALEAQSKAVTEQAEPAEGPTNLAGMTRKYNFVCMLFYGLVKALYGFEFGGLKKPSFKKLLGVYENVGMHPDDETLEKHLRHGSEQLARTAKSPN